MRLAASFQAFYFFEFELITKLIDCDDIPARESEKRSTCFRKKIKNLSTSSESQNEIIEDLLDRLDLLGKISFSPQNEIYQGPNSNLPTKASTPALKN